MKRDSFGGQGVFGLVLVGLGCFLIGLRLHGAWRSWSYRASTMEPWQIVGLAALCLIIGVYSLAGAISKRPRK